MTKDVFGTGGDFITSPEISQMFGEVCNIIKIVSAWLIWEACTFQCHSVVGLHNFAYCTYNLHDLPKRTPYTMYFLGKIIASKIL
jgi:hypothetical protein